MSKHYNLHGVRRLSVLEIEVTEGAGTEDDPMRYVTWWVDCETGDVLAIKDPVLDEPSPPTGDQDVPGLHGLDGS